MQVECEAGVFVRIPARNVAPWDVLRRKGTRELCVIEKIISRGNGPVLMFRAPWGSFAATIPAISWLFERGIDPESCLVSRFGLAAEEVSK